MHDRTVSDLYAIATRYRNYAGTLYAAGDEANAQIHRNFANRVDALAENAKEIPLPVTKRIL